MIYLYNFYGCPRCYALRGSPMTLNILSIDEDSDRTQPSRQCLLQAAEACSSTATSVSQLLLKLDALRGIMPVEKRRWLDFLPIKLLDSIRGDAERLTQDANPSARFWTSAGDMLVNIVNVKPTIGQALDAAIAAGGDIEITAHNEPGRITVTSVEPSGLRQVLFDYGRQTSQPQNAA
jgi:hypothetical protein